MSHTSKFDVTLNGVSVFGNGNRIPCWYKELQGASDDHGKSSVSPIPNHHNMATINDKQHDLFIMFTRLFDGRVLGSFPIDFQPTKANHSIMNIKSPLVYYSISTYPQKEADCAGTFRAITNVPRYALKYVANVSLCYQHRRTQRGGGRRRKATLLNLKKNKIIKSLKRITLNDDLQKKII